MQIRLFLESELFLTQKIILSKDHSHYLNKVLRLNIFDKLFIFNGKDGEFLAQIIRIDKIVEIEILSQTQNFAKLPAICLAFAPVKNVKAEYLTMKATELGVTHIQPVQTQYTIVNKVNVKKLKTNAIEAAEQSRRIEIPEIFDIISLKNFINNLVEELIIFADESGEGLHPEKLLKNISLKSNQKAYILIGPEGGFSEEERKLIRSYKNTLSLSLGPRILRADTAIISALAIAQNYLR